MLTWITLHALEIPLYLAVATALARIVYGLVARLVAPYPRLRAAVEALAAASPDVLRGLAQLYRAVTGRDLPMPLIDARDAELARLRDQLAVSQSERIELRARLAELVSAASAASAAAPPPPGTRPTSLPSTGIVTMAMLLALAFGGALGCAHRPPGAIDPTAATVLKVVETGRSIACDEGWMGRVPALNIDTPPVGIAAVIGQIRAWVCADALGSLIDLATELVTAPPPQPAQRPRTASTPDASSDADGGTGEAPDDAPGDAGAATEASDR